MAMIPIDYLKKALQAYINEHGASELGAYRDVVTDLLHLMREDTSIHKSQPCLLNGKPDSRNLLNDAWDAFQEELLNKEIEEIDKHAAKKKLPLLVNRKWEFKEAENYYKKQLGGTEEKSCKIMKCLFRADCKHKDFPKFCSRTKNI